MRASKSRKQAYFLNEAIMIKKINFIKFIQVWGIIFMIGFSASFVAIDTIDAYREFNFRVDQIRTDYID